MRQRFLPILLVLVAVSLVLTRDSGPAPGPRALGAFGRGPTIVLVHGLGSRATHWLGVARNLARDHRVVLAELPGHGLVTMPGNLALDDAVMALDHEIAAESAEPVILVGHSVGGLIAAAEALRNPGRVRALVLVETALRPQMEAPARKELFTALDQAYQPTLQAIYESFGRDSAQGASLAREAAGMEPATMRAWVRLALGADLSKQVRELNVPVLIVLSERSWPKDESWPACAEALGYTGIAGAQPVRLDDTGHFVMLDRPSDLAGAIRRFARSGTSALAIAATP